MTIESHRVLIRHKSGRAVDGILSFDPDSDDDLCRLSLAFQDGEFVAESEDYFEALCDIRRRIEPSGWMMDCYGSSRSVFPSKMSRQMGSRGLVAFKLQVGVPAQTADLVEIFGSDANLDIATVDEQEAFYEQWLTSLKSSQ